MAKKKTSKRAHGQAGPALTGGAGSAVECLPGAILWLPPESEIPFPMGDEIPPDCYDHPVAVHSEVSDGNARILIVSIHSNPRNSLETRTNRAVLGNLVKSTEPQGRPLGPRDTIRIPPHSTRRPPPRQPAPLTPRRAMQGADEELLHQCCEPPNRSSGQPAPLQPQS